MVRSPALRLLLAFAASGAAVLAFAAWGIGYHERWKPDGLLSATVSGQSIAPRTTAVDHLDVEQIARDAGLDPTQPFRIVFEALIPVLTEGPHVLRARSDDGVTLEVDDEVLFERTGVGLFHDSRTVWLSRGFHSLRITYEQQGGEALLRLYWALPRWREDFRPVPALSSTDPAPVFRRVRKAMAMPRWIAAAGMCWVGVGFMIVFSVVMRAVAGRPVAGSRDERRKWWLACLLVAACSVPYIWQGASPWQGWRPDEIQPPDVFVAADRHFANGWFHLYPPTWFYVLGVVNSPTATLIRHGFIDENDGDVHRMLHIADRLVTVGVSALLLVVIGLLAEALGMARAAPWAMVAAAGTPLFAYYSKTTNVDVPYTFFSALACLAFAVACRTYSWTSYAWLGATVAVAASIKDQAYAFFPGLALALIWLSVSRSDGGRLWSRLRATVCDSRLWIGAMACGVVYLVLLGVFWNMAGVGGHFRLISGAVGADGPETFRMFPSSVEGTYALAIVTATVAVMTMGLGVGGLALVGFGLYLRRGLGRSGLGLMSLGIISWFVTSVAVIGYVYDRFLFVPLLIMFLLAGAGAAWIVERAAEHRGLRRGVIIAMAAMLLYPSLRFHYAIAGDTRGRAQEWMESHLVDDETVVGVGTQLFMPNMYRFRHRLVGRNSISEIMNYEPDVVVLNEDWLTRPWPIPGKVLLEELEREGFAEVQRFDEARRGWEWDPLASGLHVSTLYSNIPKFASTITVWARK